MTITTIKENLDEIIKILINADKNNFTIVAVDAFKIVCHFYIFILCTSHLLWHWSVILAKKLHAQLISNRQLSNRSLIVRKYTKIPL